MRNVRAAGLHRLPQGPAEATKLRALSMEPCEQVAVLVKGCLHVDGEVVQEDVADLTGKF